MYLFSATYFITLGVVVTSYVGCTFMYVHTNIRTRIYVHAVHKYVPCMYVCMYVLMYVCMYVLMYVCINVCMY